MSITGAPSEPLCTGSSQLNPDFAKVRFTRSSFMTGSRSRNSQKLEGGAGLLSHNAWAGVYNSARAREADDGDVQIPRVQGTRHAHGGASHARHAVPHQAELPRAGARRAAERRRLRG